LKKNTLIYSFAHAMKKLFFVFLVFLFNYAHSAQLTGTITDEQHNPLPYVTVYKQNSTLAVSSNMKGQFFLELPMGKQTIVFQGLGYEKKIVEVDITEQHQTLNTTLASKTTELQEVTISTQGKDPAYEIIKNAINAREKYRKPVNGYSCDVYIKSALEKEFLEKDTSLKALLPEKIKKDSSLKMLPDKITKEKMNFIESYGKYYVDYPNNHKEIKEAYRDFSEKFTGTPGTSFGIKITQNRDPSPYTNPGVNRSLFKTNIADADFNFYYNTLDIPVLSPSPLVSPISSGAFLSYKYKLEEYFLEDGQWVNKILVTPKRTDAALFSGYIYIVDKLWCIKAVNLEVDRAYLTYFNRFNIIQKYQIVNDSIWMLGHEDFVYSRKMGQETILGNTYIDYSNYLLNPVFRKNFFTNELSTTLDSAYEKNDAYWEKLRPITLKSDELTFIHTQDSVEKYINSAAYKMRQDSIVNKVKWDEILFGITFQNSIKKQSLYLNGLVTSMNPFGVGGYRQRTEGTYRKEFSKGHDIISNFLFNYGITNNDLKGDWSTSYLYLPRKFGRLHLRYADEYGVLNSHESISRTFSMSNYIAQRTYGIGHEMELVNGLSLDVFGEYVKKRPIDNIKYSVWSQELFKADNTPSMFQGANLTLLNINLKYTIKQQYRTEPYKKINLGSRYPTFTLTYRKGIPGIANSVSNFDFIQLQAQDEIKFGTAGISKWNIYTGKYFNNKSILLTENKFFRGSDPYFFSNPLQSFQLLGPSLNTSNAFLEAHYLHRFNGSLLNKVPGIKKLHLLEVGGAGILLIEDNHFKHAEVYGGLEKVIRIKESRFKLGCYYVVANSTYSSLGGQIKFGIDFFDAFSNSWSY
jgi:hypothetical protein